MIDKRAQIIHLEKQYKFYYTNVRTASSRLFDRMYGLDEENHEDEDRFAEFWTHQYLLRMYNILCVYFEINDLQSYLFEFKERYKHIVNDKTLSIEMSSTVLAYGDSDEDLKLLIEWKNFLAPFDFFWDTDTKDDFKLRNFLKCTNQILKETKTKVSKEEDINKMIRNVANWYFTGVTAFSRGYFVNQFTSYRPDVIIEELGTAIEYKLIRSNNEVGNKLDELIIDAKRYTGNSDNRSCVAVFCLSAEVSKTEKEILEDWERLNFPDNWHLIVIPDVIVFKKLLN